MDSSPQDPGRLTPARVVPAPPPVTRLVAARTLDAELAALLWLMVESNVPVLVAASEPGPAAAATLGAFLDLLPVTTRRLELQGRRESFDWLGDAGALGWPGEAGDGQAASETSTLALPARRVAPPETTYLVAEELASGPPAHTFGLRTRTVVRALQRGYGLGAVIRAESLEGVFADLAAPPASLTADELRRLGIVVVLRARPGHGERAGPDGPGRGTGDRPVTDRAGEAWPDMAGWRVAACHYVRPLERDAAGHLQRRPPAILATWDAGRDLHEHFAWGVTAELAMRAGYPRDEFEREHLTRTRLIAGLVASRRTSHDALHALLSQRSRPRGGGDA